MPSYGGRSWDVREPTSITPAPGQVTTADDILVKGGVISGAVTDGRGTRLRPEVTLSHDGDALAFVGADDAGRYEFGQLPAGMYEVCFDAEYLAGLAPAGYLDACRVARVGEGRSLAGVDGHLTPAAGIRGRLLDASLRPVAGAEVRLTRGGSTISVHGTRSDGTYAFTRLEPGEYQVCFVTYAPDWRGCYGGAAEAGSAPSVGAYGGRFVDDIDGQITDSPDTIAPTAVMSAPSAAVQTDATIRLRVDATDEGLGVISYDLRYRYADWRNQRFSGFRAPESWQYRVGPAPHLTGTPGRTYCFSVRARDRVGNLSDHSPERCVTIPLDDRALAVSSGRWARISSAGALHGTVSRTSTYGATLSIAGASVQRIGVVVTTCPSCGLAGVYVDGRLIARRSTWSRTIRSQQLILLPAVDLGSHTVSVRLLQRRRSLIVDAVALGRS